MGEVGREGRFSRRRLRVSRLLAAVAVAAGAFSLPAADEDRSEPADVAFFERKIRPLLVRRCYGCNAHQHGH